MGWFIMWWECMTPKERTDLLLWSSGVWGLVLIICFALQLYVSCFLLCFAYAPIGLGWRRVERDHRDGIEI